MSESSVLEKQRKTNKKSIWRSDMKKEYDFSKGVRGKFYDENAQFNIPVYLEPEVESFIAKLAKEQKTNMSQIVNALLFKDKELIEIASTR